MYDLLNMCIKRSHWKGNDNALWCLCLDSLIYSWLIISFIHMSNFQGNLHMFLTDSVLNVSYQHNKDSLVSGAFSSRLHYNTTWIKGSQTF